MKYLVTGATGFVGSALCPQLAARGAEVVGLSRSGAALVDGSTSVRFDLSARNLDAGLLEGVDTVFHLAGIAHQQADDRAYDEVNHQGTLRLARLAAEAGVKRFIFLSSVKAMGAPSGTASRSEEQVAVSDEPYGRSKWQAECALRQDYADSAMAVIILRPALVYGGGAKGNLPLLLRAIRMGLPKPPADGGRSMVALPDLVQLLLRLASLPLEGVHTWNVADGEQYSTRRVYEALREADGKGKGLAWLPRWAWRLAIHCADRLRPGREPLQDKLFATELYDSSALRAATGWEPNCRLEDLAAEIVNSGGGPRP